MFPNGVGEARRVRLGTMKKRAIETPEQSTIGETGVIAERGLLSCEPFHDEGFRKKLWKRGTIASGGGTGHKL